MEGGIPITMEEIYLLNNDQDRVNALDYYPLCFTPVGTVGLFFATDIEVPADAQPGHRSGTARAGQLFRPRLPGVCLVWMRKIDFIHWSCRAFKRSR